MTPLEHALEAVEHAASLHRERKYSDAYDWMKHAKQTLQDGGYWPGGPNERPDICARVAALTHIIEQQAAQAFEEQQKEEHQNATPRDV